MQEGPRRRGPFACVVGGGDPCGAGFLKQFGGDGILGCSPSGRRIDRPEPDASTLGADPAGSELQPALGVVPADAPNEAVVVGPVQVTREGTVCVGEWRVV